MRLGRSRDFRNAFPDQGVRDDHLRFPVVALFGGIERVEKLLHVLAVDFLHIEAVSTKPLSGIFALRLLRHRVERDRVRVVNQDQVIEPEMAGESARFRGDAFLQTTVAREADHVLIEDAVLSGVETRRGHFRGHGDADSIADALA